MYKISSSSLFILKCCCYFPFYVNIFNRLYWVLHFHLDCLQSTYEEIFLFEKKSILRNKKFHEIKVHETKFHQLSSSDDALKMKSDKYWSNRNLYVLMLIDCMFGQLHLGFQINWTFQFSCKNKNSCARIRLDASNIVKFVRKVLVKNIFQAHFLQIVLSMNAYFNIVVCFFFTIIGIG